MKSRPIIFSAPMVRAILTGQKTQTRRLLRIQPHGAGSWILQGSAWVFPNICPHTTVKCPYGIVGDRLWVREAWCKGIGSRPFWYKADFIQRYGAWEQDAKEGAFGVLRNEQGWKSPLFMPYVASRIELEITGIRVERVQDITDADALAEGVEVCEVERGLSAQEEYSVLWTEIHGYHDQKGWNANPWVWVIEFKHVGGTQ